MKKQLKETLTYTPNDFTAVKVSNEPTMDRKTGAYGFKQEVTIRVKIPMADEKLSFGGEDDIRQFLDDIDLEDPQQELGV